MSDLKNPWPSQATVKIWGYYSRKVCVSLGPARIVPQGKCLFLFKTVLVMTGAQDFSALPSGGRGNLKEDLLPRGSLIKAGEVIGVECLPGIFKSLGSIPAPPKTKAPWHRSPRQEELKASLGCIMRQGNRKKRSHVNTRAFPWRGNHPWTQCLSQPPS